MTPPVRPRNRRRRFHGRERPTLAVQRDIAVLELLASCQVAPNSSVTARDIAWVLGWVEERCCPVEATARARGVLVRLRSRGVVASVHPRGPGRGYPCCWRLLPGWQVELERLRGDAKTEAEAAA